jgi:hypothetical protein
MSFILFELVCFAVLFLLSKFVFKLRTLTAISLSAFCVSALPWISFLCGVGPLGGSLTIPETTFVAVQNPGPLGGPRTIPKTTVEVQGLAPHDVISKTLFLINLIAIVVCGGILAIQFFRWASSSDNATVNAAERKRILQMVENDKISTEEGSELLDAMGRSSALRGQEKFSRLDIVMLVGAALVILGFFLPWINIRSVTQMFGRISAYQAGYQVGAIGWAICIIGILSAVPIFVTPKDFLYKISMLQIFLILIGVVLVIIVLTRAGQNLGAGIIFCLVGFVVELVAAGAKFRKLAA